MSTGTIKLFDKGATLILESYIGQWSVPENFRIILFTNSDAIASNGSLKDPYGDSGYFIEAEMGASKELVRKIIVLSSTETVANKEAPTTQEIANYTASHKYLKKISTEAGIPTFELYPIVFNFTDALTGVDGSTSQNPTVYPTIYGYIVTENDIQLTALRSTDIDTQKPYIIFGDVIPAFTPKAGDSLTIKIKLQIGSGTITA